MLLSNKIPGAAHGLLSLEGFIRVTVKRIREGMPNIHAELNIPGSLFALRIRRTAGLRPRSSPSLPSRDSCAFAVSPSSLSHEIKLHLFIWHRLGGDVTHRENGTPGGGERGEVSRCEKERDPDAPIFPFRRNGPFTRVSFASAEPRSQIDKVAGYTGYRLPPPSPSPNERPKIMPGFCAHSSTRLFRR